MAIVCTANIAVLAPDLDNPNFIVQADSTIFLRFSVFSRDFLTLVEIVLCKSQRFHNFPDNYEKELVSLHVSRLLADKKSVEECNRTKEYKDKGKGYNKWSLLRDLLERGILLTVATIIF